MNILNSATKLVLLILAVSLCVLAFLGKVSEEAFISLVGVVFWFYFTGSSTNSASDMSKDKRDIKDV